MESVAVVGLGIVGWILWALIMLAFVGIAWRAMRAHERIADSLEKFERVSRPGGGA